MYARKLQNDTGIVFYYNIIIHCNYCISTVNSIEKYSDRV